MLGVLGAPIVEFPGHSCAQPLDPLAFQFPAFGLVLFFGQEYDVDVQGIDVMILGEVGVQGHGGSSETRLVPCEPLPHALDCLTDILLAAASAGEAVDNS